MKATKRLLSSSHLSATLLSAVMAFVFFLTAPLHADIFESFGSGSNQFTMTFVPIGNPGNAVDTTGSPNLAGSVSYHYNMGKYEVSRDMVIKASAAGNLGITLADMSSFGGNGGNRPATGASWNEAARFVNWLNTSQGFSAAYKFSTQPGQVGYNANDNIELWLPTDAGYNAANLFRNTQAKYFLPSMDEWYKSAYFDPSANGGAGGYWNFATASDSEPTAVSDGTISGTAVYNQGSFQGPADINNAGGVSSYGVMGLSGNVWEWVETEYDLINNGGAERGRRGGFWANPSSSLSASFWGHSTSTSHVHSLGFRVSSVPEPGSIALLIMLSTVGLWHRRRCSI